MGRIIRYYKDANCQISHDFTRVASPGYVHTSSPQIAWSACEANNDAPILTTWKNVYDNLYICIIDTGNWAPREPNESFGSVRLDSGEAPLECCRRSDPRTNLIYNYAPDHWRCYHVWTGQSRRRTAGGDGGLPKCGRELPLTGHRLHAFDGMVSGIQFKRLDNCGVGDPAVFEMDLPDAIDIWSNIGSGLDVCFPQIGRIVFLDAATSPRTLVFPDYRSDDGSTCASLNIAGTMVLVKAPPGTATQTSTTT